MLPLCVELVHPRDDGIQASDPIVELFIKQLLRAWLSVRVGCKLLVEALAGRAISDSSLQKSIASLELNHVSYERCMTHVEHQACRFHDSSLYTEESSAAVDRPEGDIISLREGDFEIL